MARLAEAERALADADEPLLAWGLDPIFFDRRVVAADLDRVSQTRPVLVMHQSGHIINVNSKTLEIAGITRETNVQGLVRDESGEPTGELQGPALRNIVYRAAGRNRFLDMGRGDSLWRISKRFNVSVAALREWNELRRDHSLQPGQTLELYVNEAGET